MRTSPDWRWCLKIGLVVVLVDLLVIALIQGQGPDSDVAGILDEVDQIANIVLFAYVGWRTGRETGRATASAEAGVVASLLPALVALVYQILLPSAPGSETQMPLANRLVGAVALNVVLGGLSAWISGWLAGRNRPPAA